MGANRNLVFPFNLHLRNQINIQLLSITFYLHFCLGSRKVEKNIQKVPIGQCLAFKIKLTLPLLNSISEHALQLCIKVSEPNKASKKNLFSGVSAQCLQPSLTNTVKYTYWPQQSDILLRKDISRTRQNHQP